MARIIQAVPNFSEGRRGEVVDKLLEPFRRHEDCRLLDYHADPDHNRLVVTVVGEPGAVVDALFTAITQAASLIDMNEHRGSHPRVGATDVVPLIPVEGVTMQDCVALADALARRVAEELHIPVYLYEEAAKLPHRRDLAAVRRGEFEGLKESIGEPERRPDYGPSQLHPTAGATVIGARQHLVAYNVYLRTSDVGVARRIARAVRASGGGFVNVKAIGLPVEGDMVQVSMNLTDFQRTPIYRAFDFVRREAEQQGVQVAKSEIVGLVPQTALIDAARYYLRLRDFSPDEQVLERRLLEHLGDD